MSSQSQYFETFKTQLQQRLNQALDREQSLQKRIFTLEKQLLDMTVSAATGTAAISAVRITANTTPAQWGNRERLPSARGEGEGEEERNENRRKQQQPSVGIKSDERQGNDVVTGDQVEAGRGIETERDLTEARLQGFILSLQEDLRVLLEREDHSVTVRRGLMEQLQEAQENNQLLSRKVEEMKAQVNQLELSESSLNEEVEKLREENRRLEQILWNVDDQTCHPGTSTLSDTCARRCSSECCSRDVRNVSIFSVSVLCFSFHLIYDQFSSVELYLYSICYSQNCLQVLYRNPKPRATTVTVAMKNAHLSEKDSNESSNEGSSC